MCLLARDVPWSVMEVPPGTLEDDMRNIRRQWLELEGELEIIVERVQGLKRDAHRLKVLCILTFSALFVILSGLLVKRKSDVWSL